ncbi:MAG: hypothetical protein ACP5N2_00300 [Candidatus Nanoarchaeia archaeon]
MTKYYTQKINLDKLHNLSEFLVTQGFVATVYSSDPFAKSFKPNIWSAPHMDVRIYSKNFNLAIDTQVQSIHPENDPYRGTVQKIMDIVGVERVVGSITTEVYEKAQFNTI